MKTRSLLVLCLAFAWLVGGTRAADTDWRVVNVEGRDYLTIENIAEFYQLKLAPAADAQRAVLSDSRVRIETLANPREISINGVKEWLSFPVLTRDGSTLVSRFDLAKTIEPCLRPTMIGNLEPFQTVVLDAGHGGQDNGGRTFTGSEKEYTLDVIRDVKRSLEAKGFNVLLTRDQDVYLSLEQRAELANTVSNAVFVSVHFNSGEAEASGLEVYAMTPRGAASTSDARPSPDQLQQMPGNDFDNASLALANCVHHAVVGNLSTPDRGVRRARFAVLRLTHAPAILVEGGFMTSGTDSRQITDAAWRHQLAESIVAGVRSFQDVAQFKQPPKLAADYRSEQLRAKGAELLARGGMMDPIRVAFRPPTPNVSVRPVSNTAATTRPAARQEQPKVRIISVPPRKQ